LLLFDLFKKWECSQVLGSNGVNSVEKLQGSPSTRRGLRTTTNLTQSSVPVKPAAAMAQEPRTPAPAIPATLSSHYSSSEAQSLRLSVLKTSGAGVTHTHKDGSTVNITSLPRRLGKGSYGSVREATMTIKGPMALHYVKIAQAHPGYRAVIRQDENGDTEVQFPSVAVKKFEAHHRPIDIETCRETILNEAQIGQALRDPFSVQPLYFGDIYQGRPLHNPKK